MKADLSRLQSFAKVARLIQRIALEEERNPELFAFLVAVAEAFDHPELTAAGVEPLRHFASWQVLAHKGYAPEVDRCVSCGGSAGTTPAFVIAEGGIACASCAPGRAPLSRREYGALQLFLHGDRELAAGWRMEEGEGRRLDRLREEFTVYHVGVAPA